MNLNNYVAVITGGASGIGEATVRSLSSAAPKWSLLISTRNGAAP